MFSYAESGRVLIRLAGAEHRPVVASAASCSALNFCCTSYTVLMSAFRRQRTPPQCPFQFDGQLVLIAYRHVIVKQDNTHWPHVVLNGKLLDDR